MEVYCTSDHLRAKHYKQQLKKPAVFLNKLQQLTDQCVKCGLCLPHCPTYLLAQNENESPRGRISIMQAIANRQITFDATAQEHLEHCLQCRACEQVCPSEVRYGEILATFQHEHKKAHAGALPAIFADSAKSKTLNNVLRFYQNTGLKKAVSLLDTFLPSKLARLHRELPRISALPAWKKHYPALNEKKADVQLFTGCINQTVDPTTLIDAINVLNKLGVDVHIPANQSCCGAMDAHSGMEKRASSFAKNNEQVFSELPYPIITVATGCQAHLQELDTIIADQFTDVISYIIANDLLEDISLTSSEKILVHEPCSQRNVTKSTKNTTALLEKFSNSEIQYFESNHLCCGSAGTYHIQHPETADALLAIKTEEVATCLPAIVLTSNIGCALHLGRGLKEQGLNTKVMHPISLLAKALGESEK